MFAHTSRDYTRFTHLSPLAFEPASPPLARESRMLERATELASQSDHHRFRLGAMIFSGRQILACGTNRRRTHPLQHYYNPKAESIHAEVNAIINGKGRNLRGATIAIARLTSRNEVACSYPCRKCQEALSDAGIQRIICFSVHAEPVAVEIDD